MKHLIYGLSLLSLTSCASKTADFAPLPAATRIDAKTMHQGPPYGAAKKRLSNVRQIARIVTAVDAERSGWQVVPDEPQIRGSDIDLSFYSSGVEVRQFTVHSGVVSGSLGNEWNLSALDTSAGSSAERVVKLVPDAKIKALLAAIGLALPHKARK